MISFGALKSMINPSTAFGKKALEYILKEQGGEQIATHLQDLNEWAVLHPDKTLEDYLRERPNAAFQTALSTAFASGAQAGVIRSVQVAANLYQGKQHQAEQAAQLVQGINQVAVASKVAQRSPEDFAAFAQAVAEENDSGTFYIDANVLLQTGIAEQVAQLSPAVAEQLQEAAQTGGQIAIPAGEYAAQLARSEYASQLTDHIKVEPDAWSKAEAREWMQSGEGSALQREMDYLLRDKQADETFRASSDAVRDIIKGQLSAAGRFTPQVNDSYAALTSSFYAVQAAKMGITPEELYRQYPLQVMAQTPTFEAPALVTRGAYNQLVDISQDTDRGKQRIQTLAEWAQKQLEKEGFTADLQHSGSAAGPSSYLDVTDLHTGSKLDRQLRFSGHSKGAYQHQFIHDLGSEAEVLALIEELKAQRTPERIEAYQAFLARMEEKQAQQNEARAQELARLMEVETQRLQRAEEKEANGEPLSNMDRRVLKARDEGRLLRDGGNKYWQIAEAPFRAPEVRNEQGKQFNDRTFNQEARGFFDPSSNTIGLLKDADLSTYLHESGHFFLEMLVDLASRAQQEASLFGADTNTEGQAQIAKDMQILLDWFGVRDLAEWHNMDMEQKRSYHEQFARGFEAYLYEGKAPSIELQGLFRRFSAWLVRVYRELRSLNVEFSDEVRGVFDRMLASSEQIALAEQGRSMMPMFDSAQEAGMTPQEFADYQALGVQATAEAIEQLRTRGLRDMKWLRNARSRELKRLQKESRAARAEMRMQASREIMQQPVYRTWQFLTSRIAEEDRIAPADAGKATVGLDESRDSLLVAVAKLGGLNRDEVTAAWGVDPKERLQAPVFGKPVLRKTNGLSIDAMGEALAERGYLRVDEHGRFDPRDLEDAFLGELRGEPHYSIAYDYSRHEMRAGDQVPNPAALAAGRIDAGELGAMGLPAEVVQTIKARRMTAGNGLHPDIVADLFGFDSGDALMRALAATEPPADAIDGLTDALMLEQHGDLATPEAIERAADDAIHNAARMRFTATEENALARAVGRRGILVSAAKEYAQTLIGRQHVRNVRPGQYAHAEARAARAADKARRAGSLELAAAEKRNQLIQQQAARAAHDARAAVDAGLRYLTKFEGDIKGLDGEYAEQILGLLERFDLRKGQSLKAIDRRKSLAEWIAAQREAGLEPDIPPELENEAYRQSYKDMSVDEFRGLIDSVKQIEHLGRLKHRMLTAAKQRDYEAVRDEVAAGIRQHAHGRTANTRTPVTALGRALKGLKNFGAAHIKAASWARIMDGGKDGGPVWEYFIRQANVRGDMETTMRAEATAKLSAILAPVTKLGRMGGKGVWFESIGRSLNREERLAIALNTGNEGNMQRLLGGENWTLQQIMPVLQSLTSTEWQAVQAVWDHFESYRDQIAAKEKRVYGKEPQWVEPRPFPVTTADGQTLEIRGGYYPIKYDPLASMRAESHDDAEAAKRQMQGAYTSATTRRSFTKSRVSEVQGRPLLYSLAGVYSGVNDVIHDLAWHEWLIDTNRLLKSHTIDAAIREHYGPEVKQQLKQWVQDIAEGDRGTNDAVEKALGHIRRSVSVAGLGFNVVSAAMQPLGLTQSVVRVGAKWVGIGISKYIAHPIDLTKRVNSMSAFMENRARTRFRELNELRNQVQQTSAAKEWMGRNAYVLMMRFQQAVDVPTWWGAYEKAIAEGNDEARAIDLADQAVIDAQGGGQTKDLSGVERGGAYQKLFTTFYSFMNTALNLGVERTMSAHTPAQKAKLAVDYLMLFVLPAVLGELLRAGITPGDSDDFEDPEKAAKALIKAQISYLMGLLVVVREVSVLADMVGDGPSFGYQGPGGLRPIADATKLAQQAKQREFDEAFARSAINLAGSAAGIPSAQINRSIKGANALAEGDTDNPAALLFGYQEPR